MVKFPKILIPARKGTDQKESFNPVPTEIKSEWVWAESCYLWVKDNKLVNEKGVPLEFSNHRFLIDLYDDYTPVQVTRKASQVGFSTLAIIKSFHAARFKNYSQIYTLPTVGDVSNFVPPKVNRIIDQNPILKTLVKDKDTIYQKQVGNSFIYYRGTFSQKTEREKMEGGVGIMISSDLNLHDECFEPGTEVLTKEGWKEIKDVKLTDNVLTLHPKTHITSFKKPKEIIRIDYSGKLYRFIGRSIDIATSENHKWWARENGINKPFKLIKAKDLREKKFVLTSKANWKFNSKKDFVDLPYIETSRKPQGSSSLKAKKRVFKSRKVNARAWYRFLGWYLSEGHVVTLKGKARGNICITQKNKKEIEDIISTIRKIGYEPRIQVGRNAVSQIFFNDLGLALYLKRLGKCEDKYLPKRWLWQNPDWLNEFLEAAILGDGDDRNVITTKSKKLADCYQIAALRTGKTASIYQLETKDGTIYRVGINDDTYRRFNGFRGSNGDATVKIEDYKGKLWCLNVPPYHLILVRGKDKKIPLWSGNCDRSDQTVLQQYESRLDASLFKGRWFYSNPSNPNTLSQKLYEQSDQKHWFIKCGHCNYWQYLDFWKNVKEGNYVCSKCNGIITDDDRRNGQWVKKYKNRAISGYWISHLICPWKTAREIEEASKKDKTYFYNFVLGLPYRGSDIVVDKDTILKNIDTQENLKVHNVIGVDQGIKKHYVLMNEQGVFKVGMTEDWRDIERLINEYDIECGVFDGMPDITEPRKLRDKYLGKIWLSFFKRDVKKANFISWDKITHSVYSDRTKIIQQTIDQFYNRQIRFQMDIRDLEEYIKHWASLYKIVEKDQMGIEQDIWESDGEDHWAMAQIYAILALQRGGGDTTFMKWAKEENADFDQSPDVQRMAAESGKLI